MSPLARRYILGWVLLAQAPPGAFASPAEDWAECLEASRAWHLVVLSNLESACKDAHHVLDLQISHWATDMGSAIFSARRDEELPRTGLKELRKIERELERIRRRHAALDADYRDFQSAEARRRRESPYGFPKDVEAGLRSEMEKRRAAPGQKPASVEEIRQSWRAVRAEWLPKLKEKRRRIQKHCTKPAKAKWELLKRLWRLEQALSRTGLMNGVLFLPSLDTSDPVVYEERIRALRWRTGPMFRSRFDAALGMYWGAEGTIREVCQEDMRRLGYSGEGPWRRMTLEDPMSLVPDYLVTIPTLYLPEHPPTDGIYTVRTEGYAGEKPPYSWDTGGWIHLVGKEGGAHFVVDCVHPKPVPVRRAVGGYIEPESPEISDGEARRGDGGIEMGTLKILEESQAAPAPQGSSADR